MTAPWLPSRSVSIWPEVLSILVLVPIVVGVHIVFDKSDPLRTKPLRHRRREFLVLTGIVIGVMLLAMIVLPDDLRRDLKRSNDDIPWPVRIGSIFLLAVIAGYVERRVKKSPTS